VTRVKDQLYSLNVRPSKRKGQNFVINEQVLAQIVDFGNPQESDCVVEIGPGLGALTKKLAHLPQLTLIEIEPNLCAALRENFPLAKVIQADVREVDFSSLGSDLLVFGNLPYAFSTEIIFHLIEQRCSVKRAVLMLQREFVERMAAPPGGRTYGTISVGAQLWADMRKGPVISGNSFHPRTAVESRLVELTLLKQPRFPVSDPLWFRRVVQFSFSQRRKKLVNSLKASGIFVHLDLKEILSGMGIDPGRRAETLSIEEFARLASALRAP